MVFAVAIALTFCLAGNAFAQADRSLLMINDTYAKLQNACSLNTGLKIEVFESESPTYSNDGKTLKISSALVPKLYSIENGLGMSLFIAREISYAENMRAGFTGFQLEYFSDKASLILSEKARLGASTKTFYNMVKAIESTSERDKIRTTKIGVSQYVTTSDLARMMSSKMRHGVTIKKTIDYDKIGSVTGWQPIMKNAIGGVFGNLATYYGLSVASNMLDGMPISQSMKEAVKTTFTPEFLIGGLGGSVIGGTVGAIVGSMIPVPGGGAILGTFIATAPALFGANLGSEVGTNMILDYKKNKSISLKRLWDAMDVSYLVGHSVGMAAGMALGSALIPIPVVGGMVGGIVGGAIGSGVAKFAKKLFLSSKEKMALKAEEDKKKADKTTLPWVIKKNSGRSGAASDASLSQAQERMRTAYQKYVKLSATEQAGSPELQKALEEFNSAADEFKALQNDKNGTDGN